MALYKKRKRELSIIFDDYTIRFLEVTRVNNRIRAIHHKSTIENTVMLDGTIDKIEWGIVLKKHLKQNKIKASTANIVIPSSTIILRQQAMPDLPYKNLKEILNFEIGNTIHFPFNDPIYDFVKLKSAEPVFNEDGELAIKISLLAAPSAFIVPVIEALRKNRIKVISIEIPAISLYRLASYTYPSLKDEILLFSYITKDGLDIHIIDNGILSFTRHIPLDLRGYVQNYDSEVADEGQTFSEGIKKENVYIAFSSDLAYEMERAINFYHYTLNNRDKELNSCLIVSDIDFPERFYTVLNERVEPEVKPLFYKSNYDKGYEVGIGAFLKMSKERYLVNLLPDISKFKRNKWQFASIFGILVLLSSLFMGMLLLDKNRLLTEKNTELEQLIIERQEKQPIAVQNKEATRLFTEYLIYYDSVLQQHVKLVPYLDDLSKLLPTESDFIKIFWSKEGTFNISGEFTSLAVLGQYVQLLNQLEWVAKVEVLNAVELKIIESPTTRIKAEVDIYIDPESFYKGGD